MTIFNLTQHQASTDQVDAGVYPTLDADSVKDLLTFTSIPSKEVLVEKATALAELVLASAYELEETSPKAMIGGAPYFMSTLESVLKEHGIVPVYAYSERVSEDVHQPDGSVRKVNVFKHLGFVEV